MEQSFSPGRVTILARYTLPDIHLLNTTSFRCLRIVHFKSWSEINSMAEVAQRRTRSFGGCFTCRSRRIKCDEKRPKCSTCLKAGIACEGYEAKLKFVFYGSHPTLEEQVVGKSDRLHSRQQLFTGVSRLLRYWHEMKTHASK